MSRNATTATAYMGIPPDRVNIKATTGEDFEPKLVKLHKNEQKSPEYLRINSKGRVPALVTDRGVLTETPALLQYIAQAFPQAKLAPPTGTPERAPPEPAATEAGAGQQGEAWSAWHHS